MKYGDNPQDLAPQGFTSWARFFRGLDLEDLKATAKDYEQKEMWAEALSYWNAMQSRLNKLANTTPSFKPINPIYG